MTGEGEGEMEENDGSICGWIQLEDEYLTCLDDHFQKFCSTGGQ